MKITIEPTDQITTIDHGLGQCQVRVWNGVTEKGAKCILFIQRIAVHDTQDSSEFEKELLEFLPPGRVVDLRQVLR